MEFEEEVGLSKSLMKSDPVAFSKKHKTLADLFVYLSSIKREGLSLDRPVLNSDMNSFLEALIYSLAERQDVFEGCTSPWDFIFEVFEAGFYYE